MKELLNKGGAVVPKRQATQPNMNAFASPSLGDSQIERTQTNNSILNGGNFKPAGFNADKAFDRLPSIAKAGPPVATFVSSTTAIVDYGDGNRQHDEFGPGGSNSSPAPVASRAVFQGAGLGLGNFEGGECESIEMSETGK